MVFLSLMAKLRVYTRVHTYALIVTMRAIFKRDCQERKRKGHEKGNGGNSSANVTDEYENAVGHILHIQLV